MDTIYKRATQLVNKGDALQEKSFPANTFMGNEKVINICIIMLFTCLSCVNTNNTKDVNHLYYNEHGNVISIPKGCSRVKLNICIDSFRNMYVMSTKSISLVEGNSIIVKDLGVLLQDTIYYSTGELAGAVVDIVDIGSYEQIAYGKLYRDDKYIYYNGRSEFSLYPFYILKNVNPADVVFLDGGYFKDNKVVYSYGGLACTIVEEADPSTFNVIAVKRSSGDLLYFGIDNSNIFHQESVFLEEDLEQIDLDASEKESLLNQFSGLYDNN